VFEDRQQERRERLSLFTGSYAKSRKVPPAKKLKGGPRKRPDKAVKGKRGERGVPGLDGAKQARSAQSQFEKVSG